MRFRPEPGLSSVSASVKPAEISLPAGKSAQNGIVIERPPLGLARGRYPAPSWFIGLLGAALLLITVGYFYLRARKLRS